MTTPLNPYRRRRYALQPLLDWIAVRNQIEGPSTGKGECLVSFASVRLGVYRGLLYSWRRTGLNDINADHVATTLGVHPSEIWPEWWAMAEIGANR